MGKEDLYTGPVSWCSWRVNGYCRITKKYACFPKPMTVGAVNSRIEECTAIATGKKNDTTGLGQKKARE